MASTLIHGSETMETYLTLAEYIVSTNIPNHNSTIKMWMIFPKVEHIPSLSLQWRLNVQP